MGVIGELARAAGALTDAMAWPLRASHFAELLNPLWGSHVLRARVEGVWDETADARTLTLRPGRGFRRHRAGQHVRVSVVMGGTRHTRTYSISSAPERDDGLITITVKAARSGHVSRHLVRETRPGDVLEIGQPEGDFVLPEALHLRPLFVSAGSGITPVASMLQSLSARGELSDVVHLHCSPGPRQAIFGAELEELARRHPGYGLKQVFTREPGGRHLDAEELARLCPDFEERDVYACGPEGLLREVERLYDDHGLSSRVHTEPFAAPMAVPPPEVARGRVRFSRSRAEADSDGLTSLLVLAEGAGLNPPHGCRMGICHECTAVLESGCVRDLRTNELTNEPGRTVQPCVCAAVGDVELHL
jgi:ferredoxin-NADP reductase